MRFLSFPRMITIDMAVFHGCIWLIRPTSTDDDLGQRSGLTTTKQQETTRNIQVRKRDAMAMTMKICYVLCCTFFGSSITKIDQENPKYANQECCQKGRLRDCVHLNSVLQSTRLVRFRSFCPTSKKK